jgi:uncharacterized protein (TIGR03437 family)
VLIPAINSGGTVNGASFSSSVASGSIAAIFGSSLTDNTACMPPSCGPSFDANGNLIPTLAGAQVTFNGFPAPILSTPSSSQINVQVPVEVAGDPSAAVQVSLMGQDSASTTVSLAPLSPGLMSLDSTGAGQGLILNDTEANQGIQSFAAPEGSAPNSHPAAAGDVIEIYATGLGAVTPPVATGALPQGLAQTIVSPIVTIGGIPATVVFSGLANCCVGLNQVNVVVPDGIAPSDAAPILLSVGGVPSNVVTVAIQ